MDEKKIREAISEVEAIRNLIHAIHSNAIEHLTIAIEALEKQLPKKPNILSEVEDEIDFDCPECERRYVMLKEDAMQCCPYCECRFDWSEQS